MRLSPLVHSCTPVVLAMLAACGGESGSNPSVPPGIPPPDDIELGALPDSPAGRRLAWIARELNGDGFSIEEITSSFGAELLAGFPAADLQRAFAALSRELAPFEVDRVVGTPEEHRVIAALLSRSAEWYTLKVTTSPEYPHLIAGVFYERDSSLAPPPPPDWEGFGEDVVLVAPRVSFLAAELDPDCRTIAALEDGAMRQVGSAFKLYVLSTLVDEVRGGRVRWDETLAIRDDWKSLPSGFLHLRTAGSTLTIAQMSEAMIADSDNTATDHLMHHMGRTTVEAMFETAGHSDPLRNRPLLFTREFFLLKLYVAAEQRAIYLSGTESSRRLYLENELAGVDVFGLEEQVKAWKAPLALDTIEWFATSADLCRVMSRLHGELATAEGAPLRGILSKNVVLTLDPAIWTFAGFKGGSEPGLLNVNWLLERADGRTFFVSITAVDDAGPVAQGSVVRRAKDAIALLARE